MPHSAISIRQSTSFLSNTKIIATEVAAPNELCVRILMVPKATAYQVRIGTMPGTWQPAGIFNAASEIVIGGLAPGLEYSISARALGEDAVTGWSDPVVYKSL